MLDVVDASDHVVDQRERGEVHRLGLMHRACHIVLRNSARQVFVQLRSQHKDTNAGLWDTSAAGHVEAGESYAHCAVRELAEELGIEVEAGSLEELSRFTPDATTGMEHVVLYQATSDQAVSLQAEEIDAGRWLSEHELDAWIHSDPAAFTTVFRNIWQTLKRTSQGLSSNSP